ncbi:hypothetical protein T4D_3075 [Trichinella pseudospiralis]|uniref:Uncharacterized protein n=1 Tax=Trichinella pseudospiralis TaxID=6337 RepID=A0A0V1G2I2_TRIPS|nr:hypothetical protein T4D_3075 [Trichinella pseudospiralis]
MGEQQIGKASCNDDFICIKQSRYYVKSHKTLQEKELSGKYFYSDTSKCRDNFCLGFWGFQNPFIPKSLRNLQRAVANLAFGHIFLSINMNEKNLEGIEN